MLYFAVYTAICLLCFLWICLRILVAIFSLARGFLLNVNAIKVNWLLLDTLLSFKLHLFPFLETFRPHFFGVDSLSLLWFQPRNASLLFFDMLVRVTMNLDDICHWPCWRRDFLLKKRDKEYRLIKTETKVHKVKTPCLRFHLGVACIYYPVKEIKNIKLVVGQRKNQLQIKIGNW